MGDLTFENVITYAVPMIFAITVHEASHGYAARYFGDKTAEMRGRLSLNPLRHIDPIGTILLPALLFLSPAHFLFGWAKPVPVNFGNLRNPKADMLWVAAAGPASNLIMAVIWALLHNIAVHDAAHELSLPMQQMAEWGMQVNISLMVLNLLPIPPLDGGRILVSLLPPRAAYYVSRIEPFGMFIIIVLAYEGILWAIMQPLFRFAFALLQLIY